MFVIDDALRDLTNIEIFVKNLSPEFFTYVLTGKSVQSPGITFKMNL